MVITILSLLLIILFKIIINTSSDDLEDNISNISNISPKDIENEILHKQGDKETYSGQYKRGIDI
jgi:hypothetical protein